MPKVTLTINLNINDTTEVDLLDKIEILRKNERLSEFCSQAIKKALDDAEACEAINKKIELNGYGTLLDRASFYDQVNKKLAYLENQINMLRYDMHTAAVLADKAFYKELAVDVLSTIDALFQNIRNNVQIYPGDYIDTMRWKQRETELQNQFASSLNNMRMIQAALSLDDEPLTQVPQQPVKTELHSELLEEQRQSLFEQHEQLTEQSKQILDITEKITELVNGITDIKEVLLNSDIILQNNTGTVKNTNVEQQVTPELPEYVPPVATQYEEAPSEFIGDLTALADFFGA